MRLEILFGKICWKKKKKKTNGTDKLTVMVNIIQHLHDKSISADWHKWTIEFRVLYEITKIYWNLSIHI